MDFMEGSSEADREPFDGDNFDKVWKEYVDAENWKYTAPGGPIKDESLKDLI